MDTEATVLEKPVEPVLPPSTATDGMLPRPESILSEAAHMSAAACFHRAQSIWNGTDGFPVDRSEAALWYEQAAEKGLPAARFEFAECLRWGDGIVRNPTRAEILYRLAAEGGDERAIHWLAHAYAVGDGVRRDRAEAAKWQKEMDVNVLLSPFVQVALWVCLGAGLATLAGWWWVSQGGK